MVHKELRRISAHTVVAEASAAQNIRGQLMGGPHGMPVCDHRQHEMPGREMYLDMRPIWLVSGKSYSQPRPTVQREHPNHQGTFREWHVIGRPPQAYSIPQLHLCCSKSNTACDIDTPRSYLSMAIATISQYTALVPVHLAFQKYELDTPLLIAPARSARPACLASTRTPSAARRGRRR